MEDISRDQTALEDQDIDRGYLLILIDHYHIF